MWLLNLVAVKTYVAFVENQIIISFTDFVKNVHDV